MSPPEHPRIFISCAHRDGGGLAEHLQRDQEDLGFDTWLDRHRLRGADLWDRQIETEIDGREVTMALLSTGGGDFRRRAGGLRVRGQDAERVGIVAGDQGGRVHFLALEAK